MMSSRQRDFFRALFAPFPDGSYYQGSRGGRNFTYIKARTIMVRLDDVAGPQGWVAEYQETKNGYMCRLKICCPDDTELGMAWHYKQDGAGREEMGQKDRATGEWEEDVDNSEKAAYTNAFRRAAAMWGFGRELYGEGIPEFLADLYDTPRQDGSPRQPTPTRGQREYGLSIPTSPRAAFPWLKAVEEHYGRDLLHGVNAHCKKEYGTWKVGDLDTDQLEGLIHWVVRAVKSWDNYAGEFDEVFPDDGPRIPPPRAEPQDQGPDNAALKRSIVAAAKTLITRQSGRAAEDDEVRTCLGELAAAAADGQGRRGEVLSTLRDCEDRTWLQGILKQANIQIGRFAQQPAGRTDEVPF